MNVLNLCSGVLLSLLLLHPGLFPAQSSDQVVGSVRDSVYCCVAVWSLYLSYNRMDDDRGKSYELGQTCVFGMRGILACWIKQSHRLEAWKQNQVASSHE